MLNDDQIDLLDLMIRESGVSLPSLREDFLDHFCSFIEAEMETGNTFEDALKRASKEIAPEGLEEFQWQTILYLNHNKVLMMRKAVFSFGFLSAFVAVTGLTFKFMHWPTAGVLFTTGTGLFFLLFIPAYFGLKIYWDRKTGRPSPIWRYVLNGLIFAIFGLTLMFRTMHWPGADVLSITSFLTLLFVFLPLTFINWYKRSEQVLESKE